VSKHVQVPRKENALFVHNAAEFGLRVHTNLEESLLPASALLISTVRLTHINASFADTSYRHCVRSETVSLPPRVYVIVCPSRNLTTTLK
jgi:hypothetical protein